MKTLIAILTLASICAAQAQTFDPRTGTMVQPQQYQYTPYEQHQVQPTYNPQPAYVPPPQTGYGTQTGTGNYNGQ